MSNDDLPAIVLIVPGLHGSGEAHWQSAWERTRADCRRVEQKSWDEPDPFEWSYTLQRAVEAADRPVVLAAHSLGCLLVAHWASVYASGFDTKVAGALLVAPCDPERPGVPAQVARFLPLPRRPLPFRTTVVASRDDPYATIERSRCFADLWGGAFVDAGELGHINAASGLGDWSFGQVLLDEILAATRDAGRHARLAALRSAGLNKFAGCWGGDAHP